MHGRLHYHTIVKGLEESVEAAIADACDRGDWIFLDNLHLASDWLPVLEDIMSKWKQGADFSSRFRMWITCIPGPDFPAYILQSSIKVAI